jgi:hypothetical protein
MPQIHLCPIQQGCEGPKRGREDPEADHGNEASWAGEPPDRQSGDDEGDPKSRDRPGPALFSGTATLRPKVVRTPEAVSCLAIRQGAKDAHERDQDRVTPLLAHIGRP